MRAIALTEYGDADVMSVQELPDPLVGPDVVLVRIAAAGVNPVDYKIRQGNLRERFPHHVPLIPGWDVAGTVEQVGPAVTEFTAGDEVLGYVRQRVAPRMAAARSGAEHTARSRSLRLRSRSQAPSRLPGGLARDTVPA